MTTKANLHEVKAKLSEYIDRALGGEHIVICRHNKPVAELRPIEPARSAARTIGRLRGRPTFKVPASFFEPMSDEELGLWEAGGSTDPLSAPWTVTPQRGATKIAESKGELGTKAGHRTARRRS